MSTTLVAMYKDQPTLERAYQALMARGVPQSHVSVLSHQEVAHKADITPAATSTNPKTNTSNTGTAAAAGAAGGAVGGVLASLAMAALPGIGWILAAGPIGSMIASGVIGAGVGAVAGGVTGAFQEAGVSERDANIYSEALRRGASVLLLTVADNKVPTVRATLERFDPVDIDKAATRWESNGWQRYDHKAASYTGSEAARERAALHGDSVVDAKSGDRYRTRTYATHVPVDDDYTLREDSLDHRNNASTARYGSGDVSRTPLREMHPDAK